MSSASGSSSPPRARKQKEDERPRFFDTKAKGMCWTKAETVPGRHPERWRKDAAGNVVCKRFCNCQGCLCFEYDHIIPFSKGGESVAENCQILQTRVNRFKSDKEAVDGSMLKGYSCDVKFTAENLPPPHNPPGLLGVADLACDIIAESEQDANRDSAQVARRRRRFKVRRPILSSRRETDPMVETLILTAAAAFPCNIIRYPAPSSFYPCSAVLLYLIRYMDHLMVSTKCWTDDHCTGWTPVHSMIYISVLFYIQVMRAMESAGAIPPRSELNMILSAIQQNFSYENLWIPGPLVQFFKNLACCWPSKTFGVVTPYIPDTPNWIRTNTRYGLPQPMNDLFPNIPALISRLRNVCAVATRDNMTEFLFANDVNGPNHLSSLFGRNMTNDELDQRIMVSPGLKLALPGNLSLWQNAAASLDFSGMPPALDQANINVSNSWIEFTELESITDWFGPLSDVMAKYCRFWRGSCPLSDCAPDCSSSGVIKCHPTGKTDLFNPPTWNAQAGEHNHNTHGNANQFGHYTLHTNRVLQLDASTTILDIPKSMYYGAVTYAINTDVHYGDPPIRDGNFWDCYPDLAECRGITVIHGVITSIARDYHCDYPTR